MAGLGDIEQDQYSDAGDSDDDGQDADAGAVENDSRRNGLMSTLGRVTSQRDALERERDEAREELERVTRERDEQTEAIARFNAAYVEPVEVTEEPETPPVEVQPPSRYDPNAAPSRRFSGTQPSATPDTRTEVLEAKAAFERAMAEWSSEPDPRA